MRIIRFKVAYPPYQAGELAGFGNELADQLVAQGIAEHYFAEAGSQEAAPESSAIDDYEDRMLRSRRRREE